MGITRTRPKSDEDEDYTPPARTRRAERDDEDGYADEDEDAPAVGSGWGAAKKVMAETATGDSFKFPNSEDGEQARLIKFAEDEPFASYKQHWVEEITKGKRSFGCLEKKCPLCAVGHQPRAMIVFNVIDIASGQIQPLEAGPSLAKILIALNDGRNGPLSRHYWEVSRSGGGKKGPVRYNLDVVKARDLADDFELDADEVAAVVATASKKALTSSWVKFPSVQDLEDIVSEHLSD